MNNEVKEVLQKAAEMVSRGWNQGGMGKDGNYCLRAAIGLAAGAYVEKNGSIGFDRIDVMNCSSAELADHSRVLGLDLDASRLVMEHLPEPFDSIVLFNDSRGTTQADVVRVLEKAAASC